jgi:hypothetical protein
MGCNRQCLKAMHWFALVLTGLAGLSPGLNRRQATGNTKGKMGL